MRTAETELSIIRERGVAFSKEVTGELRETETLMRSLGEGRWKSADDGNSLAAYPTARYVRGEGKGTPTGNHLPYPIWYMLSEPWITE